MVIQTPDAVHVVSVMTLRRFVSGHLSLESIDDGEDMMRSITESWLEMLKGKGFLDLIFGVGSGTPQYQFKTIEIDFFDLAMYFGFPIAFVFLNYALLSVFIPLLMFKTRPFAPLVFLINFVFLFLSFLSGHVWNSGMLGISWGAVNALLVIKHSK